MAREDEGIGAGVSGPESAGSETNPGARTRSERGFAAMNPEEQRRIAAKGGKASSESQQRDRQGQFAGRRRSETTETPSEGGSSMESNRAGE